MKTGSYIKTDTLLMWIVGDYAYLDMSDDSLYDRVVSYLDNLGVAYWTGSIPKTGTFLHTKYLVTFDSVHIFKEIALAIKEGRF